MTIDVNGELYQENIGELGMQGCGKTHHARELLDQMPNVPRLIYSPQSTMENYGKYGDPIDKISDIENNRAMLWVGDFSENTFSQINNRIYNEISKMCFVVDDCHEHCSKQAMNKEWQRVIQSKRNDKIFGLYISPAPNVLHNTILQSFKHIFAFRFNLFSQCEWLANNYFGQEGWLLLDKKIREQNKKVSPIHNEVEFLAKGSYLYKGWKDIDTQIFFSEFQEIAKQDDSLDSKGELKEDGKYYTKEGEPIYEDEIMLNPKEEIKDEEE